MSGVPAGGLDLPALRKRQDAALQITTRLLEIAEGAYSGDPTSDLMRVTAARGELKRLQDVVEDATALMAEVEALRAALRPRQEFFQKCWDAARQGYGLDGGEVQDWGEELGLLVRVVATEPCGEGCVCAEYTDEFPTDCYRPVPTPNVGAPPAGAPE